MAVTEPARGSEPDPGLGAELPGCRSPSAPLAKSSSQPFSKEPPGASVRRGSPAPSLNNPIWVVLSRVLGVWASQCGLRLVQMVSVALNNTKLQEGWTVRHCVSQDKSWQGRPRVSASSCSPGRKAPHGHKVAAFLLKSSLSPAQGWRQGPSL